MKGFLAIYELECLMLPFMKRTIYIYIYQCVPPTKFMTLTINRQTVLSKYCKVNIVVTILQSKYYIFAHF